MKEINKFTFYGQFDPPVDKFLYERYFSTFDYPGFFIECGAADGLTESSCKFFEESLGWRGINIEPSHFLFESLKLNRPKATNVNVGLSSENGKNEFTNVIHPIHGKVFGNGSIQHVPSHRDDLVRQGCSFETCSIKTRTFRDLIVELNVAEIDLMVLDVEGHELSVLKGMKRAKTMPRIFCVEYGQLGLDAITPALTELGYQLDCIQFVNSFWIRTGFPANERLN